MREMAPRSDAGVTRRDVLLAGVAAAGAGLVGPLAGRALGQPASGLDDRDGGQLALRVGLIGCGGRGTGAAIQSLGAESGTVLHAVGDVFPGRIESCLELVAQESDAERIQVSEDRQFLGLDAYKHVIEACDVVLLCTPPGFRPLHLREAVDKGRHVFCEKPVAVDGPGVRSVLESARIAQEKNLALMSGFCWRYQNQCRETFTHLHNGGIGALRAIHTTYNTTGWVEPKPRQPEWSDIEFQLRNWHYFSWLSGDHIVEQAVHAIDWIHWAMQGQMPTRVTATGGRSTRPDLPETGNVWDNFAATFEYKGGLRAFHMCRHWPNTPSDNTAYFMGAEGYCAMNPWTQNHVVEGVRPWKGSAAANDMYQQEHDELFASIRGGTPINDGQRMAESTLMAIMARDAAYSGRVLTLDEALNSERSLGPTDIGWHEYKAPGVPKPGTDLK
ncbi:MAG: Gfo/Idh/MocA family oxidoreductase [Phycisphaeraceae bacterium]|nr:Gfo/Idh/MocA family oxidoreductase [Phycisphaerales bacterium]MCB9843534.1 Gfo/Idh/MocA family oxidoreductase [Phycisphaeraceae bacterium]